MTSASGSATIIIVSVIAINEIKRLLLLAIAQELS